MQNRRLIYGMLVVLCILTLTILAVGCNEETEGQVSYEEAVIDGSLNVDDDLVVQTMLVNEDVPEEDIIRLAEEKAEELKTEYPEHKINVQAVQSGENIADIILE